MNRTTPPPPPPAVTYTHRVPFTAVRTEHGPRGTGTPELVGHSYVAEFLFEAAPEAGDEAIGLAGWDTTLDTVLIIDTWIGENLRGNLDRMGFATTPHGIAWYLFDMLADHSQIAVDLVAITITVGGDSYTLRPAAGQ